jgi:hypothetical protein
MTTLTGITVMIYLTVSGTPTTGTARTVPGALGRAFVVCRRGECTVEHRPQMAGGSALQSVESCRAGTSTDTARGGCLAIVSTHLLCPACGKDPIRSIPCKKRRGTTRSRCRTVYRGASAPYLPTSMPDSLEPLLLRVAANAANANRVPR